MIRPASPARAAESPTMIGKNGWLFPSWERLQDPEDALSKQQLDLIAKARDLFATKGIAFVLAMLPMKARYYLDQLPNGTTMSPAVRARYGNLLRWAADRKIMTVDLASAILPVGSVPDETIFLHTDQHWTGWSAEAAGAALADFIKANIALPPPKGPGAILGNWMTSHWLGDLAKLLPPEEQARYAPETYITREPIDVDLPLQDKAGNDIAVPDPAVRLVGGSVLRPFFGLPQKMSNMLDRPIALTWLRGDTGQWKTLLNYVESPGFRNKPSVIVWEMPEAEMPRGPMSPGWWFKSSLMTSDEWLTRFTAAVAAVA